MDRIPVSDRQDQPADLQGFIDGVDNGRVFGWAFDRNAPDRRVAVQLRRDGELVDEAVADRRRGDLIANGVGDGAHAFELPLPGDLADRDTLAEDLTVSAVSEQGNLIAVVCRDPVNPADVGDLQRGMLRTVELADASRRSQAAWNGATGRALRDVQQRLADMPKQADIHSALAPVADVEPCLRSMDQRLAGLAVHLLRLDDSLRQLAESADATDCKKYEKYLRITLIGSLCFGLAAVTAILVLIGRQW